MGFLKKTIIVVGTGGLIWYGIKLYQKGTAATQLEATPNVKSIKPQLLSNKVTLTTDLVLRNLTNQQFKGVAISKLNVVDLDGGSVATLLNPTKTQDIIANGVTTFENLTFDLTILETIRLLRKRAPKAAEQVKQLVDDVKKNPLALLDIDKKLNTILSDNLSNLLAELKAELLVKYNNKDLSLNIGLGTPFLGTPFLQYALPDYFEYANELTQRPREAGIGCSDLRNTRPSVIGAFASEYEYEPEEVF